MAKKIISDVVTAAYESANHHPDVGVLSITPTLAKQILTACDFPLADGKQSNRRLRSALVSRYAQTMKHNDWMWNGETIKFSVSGRLLDGQHRLSAILRSKKAQVLLVVFNLPDEAQNTIDTGLSRKAADVLAIEGYRNTTLLAATARVYFLWASGKTTDLARATKVDNLAVLKVVRETPDLVSAVTDVKNDRDLTQLLVGRFAAFMLCISRRQNQSAAKTFFEQLSTGEDLVRASPVYALRKFLWNLRLQARDQHTLPRMAPLIAVIRAWNATLDGERLATVHGTVK